MEREPQGTQRQTRSSQRILSEHRENPCLQVYQARGMAGRFVTIVVKNKTFISEGFGHGIAKRTCAPAKQVVF